MDSNSSTPTEAGATNCLDTMPPEVFEMIALSLPPSDLFSLRLTSQECETKVIKTYGEYFFGTRKVLLSDAESFERLSRTINYAHPELIKCCTTLEIYVDWWEHQHWMTYKEFQKEREASWKFFHSQLPSNLLFALLMKLSKRAKLTTVNIKGNSMPEEHRIEYDRAGKTDHEIMDWFHPAHRCDVTPFMWISDALESSDIKLETFCMQLPDREKLRRRDYYSWPVHRLGGNVLPKALANVSVSNLTLDVWHFRGRTPESETANDFCSALTTLLNLKNLTLRFTGRVHDRQDHRDIIPHSAILTDALFAQRFPVLTSLHLTGAETLAMNVKTFAEAHKTLAKMSFRDSQFDFDAEEYHRLSEGTIDGPWTRGPVVFRRYMGVEVDTLDGTAGTYRKDIVRLHLA